MPDDAQTPPRRGKFISGPRRLLGAVVLLISGYVFFLFFSGRVETFEIDGPSMEPTLLPGDRVFVGAADRRPLERGDLVIFHNPVRHLEGEVLVKRVVGLPGDHIEVRDHRLQVNGVAEWLPSLGEPLVLDLDDGEFTLASDQLYVLGDNREHSMDSTEFGPLSLSAVTGRVTFCYWPLGRLGYVN
jgi:signal peptidase I